MRIEVQVQGLTQAIEALTGSREKVRQQWGKTTYSIGGDIVQTIVEQYRSAANTTATATARRTGALARSYDRQVSTDATGVELRVGTIRPGTSAKVLEYAATHEFGATITPKRSHYLAIPLDAAKTASGVARGGPRDYLDTFVKRGPSGRLIIYQRTATGITPLFVLHPGPITIPARPAILPSLAEHLPRLLEQLTEDVLEATRQ